MCVVSEETVCRRTQTSSRHPHGHHDRGATHRIHPSGTCVRHPRARAILQDRRDHQHRRRHVVVRHTCTSSARVTDTCLMKKRMFVAVHRVILEPNKSAADVLASAHSTPCLVDTRTTKTTTSNKKKDTVYEPRHADVRRSACAACGSSGGCFCHSYGIDHTMVLYTHVYFFLLPLEDQPLPPPASRRNDRSIRSTTSTSPTPVFSTGSSSKSNPMISSRDAMKSGM